VLTKYLKYLVIFFGKMLVALKRAACYVVAFGGSIDSACVPKLYQQLINTTLCPAFLWKFVCQPFAVHPFKYELKFCPRG